MILFIVILYFVVLTKSEICVSNLNCPQDQVCLNEECITRAPTPMPTNSVPTITASPTAQILVCNPPCTNGDICVVFGFTDNVCVAGETQQPTFAPTGAPTTKAPTLTAAPTVAPTTKAPTFAPTLAPTTKAPTVAPTLTAAPTTTAPTFAPTTKAPTAIPTVAPTLTAVPTVAPTTKAPTFAPTTKSPTAIPTVAPTLTIAPTVAPTTKAPTFAPTLTPTVAPTTIPPTFSPTLTVAPTTKVPTFAPTLSSTTKAPTAIPTVAPTLTVAPTTKVPTSAPTLTPTVAPTTIAPTSGPTLTVAPTTTVPTFAPTVAPTLTAIPTVAPSTTTAPTTGSPTTSFPTITSVPTQDQCAFCTFTQGSYHTRCKKSGAICSTLTTSWQTAEPGCIRDACFSRAIVLGNSSNGGFSVIFDTPLAIAAFLPASRRPSVFTVSGTNPLTTSAGVFAGQLVTAILNAQFSTGAFTIDQLAFSSTCLLVDPAIIGLSVSELIYIANQVIAGFTVSPFTPQILSDALAFYNENFHACANHEPECFICQEKGFSIILPREPEEPVDSTSEESNDMTTFVYVFLSTLILFIVVVVCSNTLRARRKLR